MTEHRREAKYLVTAEQARALAAVLDQHLESHRHRGEGANLLPAAHHYVTTIYFDTASRALFRAAHGADSHLKLRAKEYYDLHPGLTETATDPRQLVRFQPVLWLELKHRDGAHSGKRRIGIPKRDVTAFFANGTISLEMIAIQEASFGSEARAVLDAVAALCASCAEPLRADCLVNYRRTAWQDPAGEVRVTIDTGLAFFAPPEDLWARDWALVRPTLGAAIATESRRVLELKSHGDLPAWLVAALQRFELLPTGFSKFEAASTAIHA
jgi:hypothetical protein